MTHNQQLTTRYPPDPYQARLETEIQRLQAENEALKQQPTPQTNEAGAIALLQEEQAAYVHEIIRLEDRLAAVRAKLALLDELIEERLDRSVQPNVTVVAAVAPTNGHRQTVGVSL